MRSIRHLALLTSLTLTLSSAPAAHAIAGYNGDALVINTDGSAHLNTAKTTAPLWGLAHSGVYATDKPSTVMLRAAVDEHTSFDHKYTAFPLTRRNTILDAPPTAESTSETTSANESTDTATEPTTTILLAPHAEPAESAAADPTTEPTTEPATEPPAHTEPSTTATEPTTEPPAITTEPTTEPDSSTAAPSSRKDEPHDDGMPALSSNVFTTLATAALTARSIHNNNGFTPLSKATLTAFGYTGAFTTAGADPARDTAPRLHTIRNMHLVENPDLTTQLSTNPDDTLDTAALPATTSDVAIASAADLVTATWQLTTHHPDPESITFADIRSYIDTPDNRQRLTDLYDDSTASTMVDIEHALIAHAQRRPLSILRATRATPLTLHVSDDAATPWQVGFVSTPDALETSLGPTYTLALSSQLPAPGHNPTVEDYRRCQVTGHSSRTVPFVVVLLSSVLASVAAMPIAHRIDDVRERVPFADQLPTSEALAGLGAGLLGLIGAAGSFASALGVEEKCTLEIGDSIADHAAESELLSLR